MNVVRKQRLVVVLFVLMGAAATLAFSMLALRENVNLFYEPAKVTAGEAPVGERIRAGGMVRTGSVAHDATGLGVRFVVTDHRGHEFEVRYSGILPGLFGEGQGVLATGTLAHDGVFHADEIVAKHDENYMPPELEDILPTTRGPDPR